MCRNRFGSLLMPCRSFANVIPMDGALAGINIFKPMGVIGSLLPFLIKNW